MIGQCRFCAERIQQTKDANRNFVAVTKCKGVKYIKFKVQENHMSVAEALVDSKVDVANSR